MLDLKWKWRINNAIDGSLGGITSLGRQKLKYTIENVVDVSLYVFEPEEQKTKKYQNT